MSKNNRVTLISVKLISVTLRLALQCAIAASFAATDMAEDWLSAFVMGSILLNPQLLFYSAALGVPALLIRFVSCFLCGVAAGIAVRLFFRNKRFFSCMCRRKPLANSLEQIPAC